MKIGCGTLVAIALLVLVLSIGYCGRSLYIMQTTEIASATLVVKNFVELYNKDDFSAIYMISDSDLKKSTSAEKLAEQMKKLKEMTGKVKIVNQMGSNMQVFNSQKYMRLSFKCTGDKGNVLMTVNMHDEMGWKVQGVNFNLKLN
jgi:hypothetical protein